MDVVFQKGEALIIQAVKKITFITKNLITLLLKDNVKKVIGFIEIKIVVLFHCYL